MPSLTSRCFIAQVCGRGLGAMVICGRVFIRKISTVMDES
jgi:hypothetical protein